MGVNTGLCVSPMKALPITFWWRKGIKNRRSGSMIAKIVGGALLVLAAVVVVKWLVLPILKTIIILAVALLLAYVGMRVLRR